MVSALAGEMLVERGGNGHASRIEQRRHRRPRAECSGPGLPVIRERRQPGDVHMRLDEKPAIQHQDRPRQIPAEAASLTPSTVTAGEAAAGGGSSAQAGEHVRYIVVGPGAIGGTVGGLLARAGHDVVLAARGAHLAALRGGGLTVATPTETFTVRPPVIAGPTELRLTAGDALILAVKSQDTAAVLATWNGCPVTGGAWAPDSQAADSQARDSQAADSVRVFCMQNGVDNEREAAPLFAHVYGGGGQMPDDLLEPGQVVAPGTPVAGVMEIGRYPAGTGQAAERLAADLTASGFIASVTGQVMTAKYTKLLRNLRTAIIAACGSMDS